MGTKLDPLFFATNLPITIGFCTMDTLKSKVSSTINNCASQGVPMALFLFQKNRHIPFATALAMVCGNNFVRSETNARSFIHVNNILR
jgi:hypothetical protein